ncbi:MAG: 1-deoxy-D-xylulose-5-phosphate reductoisomerase [Maricaulaceae bacterium]|jgi:1-deoxy-D-xylulose-5-phosphate reductoisomerase
MALMDAEIASKPAVAEKRVAVLGATGSVGRATLDLVARVRAAHGPDACPIAALTAHSNVDELAALARTFRADLAVIADPAKHDALKSALAGTSTQTAAGAEAVIEAAQRPSDWVMAAIVGAAGLAPTIAGAKRGAEVALANKEALVCAGDILMQAARAGGGALLPVDSEHNAIFQVLESERPHRVEKLTLTASGGPFRGWSLEEMRAVTPEMAVNHPVWSMGAKISVDSATMMNKGLELIEAHHLFEMPAAQLDVLVHPQSIVHSLVSYVDGSVLAQLASPDMRVPIAHALAWPDRMESGAERLDLAAIGTLTFEPPDEEAFYCLKLARQALAAGGNAPAALNAANEVAVSRFLDRQIGFLDISRVVESVLESCDSEAEPRDAGGASLDDRLALDAAARRWAEHEADALAA